jgi:hypothetical protein
MAQLQGPGQWVDVMKRKRAIHEEVINLVQKQRSNKLADKVNMLHAIALNNTEFHKSQWPILINHQLQYEMPI